MKKWFRELFSLYWFILILRRLDDVSILISDGGEGDGTCMNSEVERNGTHWWSKAKTDTWCNEVERCLIHTSGIPFPTIAERGLAKGQGMAAKSNP